MKTSDELTLVDTNVLIAFVMDYHPHHRDCVALLNRSKTGEEKLCLSPPVLAEFYSIVTNPKRGTKPLESIDALDIVHQFINSFGMQILTYPKETLELWVSYLDKSPVVGAKVFDFQIAATMLGNGIRQVYSYNREEFELVEGIVVLTPSEAR
jgi:predicted nucleic acid-binding protein